MTPKLAVVSFPGNNCEIETVRAGKRNGFETELVRWNEKEKIGSFDAYILGGGFSFEDRGRSGALAAREEIFDSLREEARRGKVILGICNGAQMIVESGLIPVDENPAPFALAENIRRDENGKVLGTGYYNTWVSLIPERTDTAFTNSISKEMRVPIAHGEGRFTSRDGAALSALEKGDCVAFRYCDKNGKADNSFPTTPNGAAFATAMIVNREGTVGAIMPHPERFYDLFGGDQVFQSMKKWLEDEKSPPDVQIGDFSRVSVPEISPLETKENSILLEKKLLITDNEAFSVSSVASKIAGEEMFLQKSILFEISGENLDRKKILDSGLIYNPNKEQLIEFELKEKSSNSQQISHKYAVLSFENDQADALAQKLSDLLGGMVKVQMYTCWDFGEALPETIQKVLQNRLLANPNSAQIFSF